MKPGAAQREGPLRRDTVADLARAERAGAAPGTEPPFVPAESSPLRGGRATFVMRTLAGVACGLAAWHAAHAGYLHGKAWLGQRLLERAWVQSARSGADVRPWPWADTHPVARIVVPGRDVALEYVDLELTDLDRNGIERRAKAMLSSKPDLVLVGEDGIEPLMRLTREIPLVFYEFSGNPVAMGLVKSFNRPGGNVTGTTLTAPDAIAKGWQMLRDLAPKAKRLGVMWRKEDLDDPWAIMVRPNDSRWRTALNHTLQALWRDGVYQTLYEKHFGSKPKFYMWSPYKLQPGIGKDD